jgi:AAA domain, putative AbiEii toxin, Type IV TA system
MFEQTPLWYWVEGDQIVGPKTMEDLHAAIAAGHFQPDDVVSLDPYFKDRFSPLNLNLPNLRFSPALPDFIASRQQAGVTIICGPNNCGKTVLLKALYYLCGVNAYLLNVNRFSQFDHLSYAQAKVAFQVYRSFRQNLFTQRLNFEDNLVSL